MPKTVALSIICRHFAIIHLLAKFNYFSTTKTMFCFLRAKNTVVNNHQNTSAILIIYTIYLFLTVSSSLQWLFVFFRTFNCWISVYLFEFHQIKSCRDMTSCVVGSKQPVHRKPLQGSDAKCLGPLNSHFSGSNIT